MKKRVTFSENQTIHRLKRDDAPPRFYRAIGTDPSKTAIKDQQTTIKIPRTMSTAPYLQHAALTPAQKEFLYTIAASHSPAHVRSLINRHYMNVLHRCVGTGDRPRVVVASPENKPENLQMTTRGEAPPSSKLKRRTNAIAGRSRKSVVPNRPSRSWNLSPNLRTTKKRATASQKRKNPTRARMKLLDDEDDEEEFTLDSLSDSMSSLSMSEWDDETFSDI